MNTFFLQIRLLQVLPGNAGWMIALIPLLPLAAFVLLGSTCNNRICKRKVFIKKSNYFNTAAFFSSPLKKLEEAFNISFLLHSPHQ